MNHEEKELFFKEFNTGLHLLGRLMLIIGVILLMAVPFVVGSVNHVSPDLQATLAGLLSIGIIYIPTSIVEFLIYAPMLGVGGSYLAFLTGNLTNMKIPCAMNARDIAHVEVGTPENEIVSTMSVAISALTTTLVIVAGVILLTPLQPILQSEALLPAFNNVVPALFGALGLKYFIKSPKIAVIPLLFMCLLCVFVPSMITQTSTLIIPAGALALIIGFILFKKGMI